MKGLLLKDFYTLFKQMKLILLIVLIFALIPGFSASSIAVIYAAMMPITALAYDERSKWDNLAATMPYTVKSIVTSKFIIGYIGIAGASVISILSQLIVNVANHSAFETDMLVSTALTACVAAVLMALNITIIFRLGVEKGRVMFYILIGAVVALSTVFGDDLEKALSAPSFQLGTVVLAVSAAALIVNLILIALSIKMYKHRVL